MNLVNETMKYDKKLLNEGLKEKLQDSVFKDFVSKLKTSNDILKKYTSLLEESCTEYNNCKNCRGLFECNNKLNGYCHLPKVKEDRIKFEYKACKYTKESVKNNVVTKNIRYYDVPPALKEACFENIDKTIKARFKTIEWLNDFVKKYPSNKGLYLHGSFGCGKSYLISACLNELAKKNIKSCIVFWPEFLRNLKSSFDSDYEQKIDYIKNVELLLIDDLGAENVTNWGRDEILGAILQYRMDNKKTTFVTSNLNITELESHLSSSKDGVDRVKARRIIERIKFLTVDVELVSKNLRS